MDAKANLEEKRKAYLAARAEKKKKENQDNNNDNNASNSVVIDRKAAMLSSHMMTLGGKKEVGTKQNNESILLEKNEVEAFALDEALRIYYQFYREQHENNEENQNIISKDATIQLRNFVLDVIEGIDVQLYKEYTYSIPDPAYSTPAKATSDIRIREQRDASTLQARVKRMASEPAILSIVEENPSSPPSSPSLLSSPSSPAIPPQSLSLSNLRLLSRQSQPLNPQPSAQPQAVQPPTADDLKSADDEEGKDEKKDELEEKEEVVPARGRRAMMNRAGGVEGGRERRGNGGTSQRLANVSGRPRLSKDGTITKSSEDIPSISFTRSLIDSTQIHQILNEKLRDFFKSTPQIFLPTPSSSKSKFEFYSHSVKGPRSQNEDEFVVIEHASSLLLPSSSLFSPLADYSFIGVYDGHNGKKASLYSRSQLHYNVFTHADFDHHLPRAIHDAFLTTDKRVNFLQQREKSNFGTTALSVWIRDHRDIIVANVGDCRGFLHHNNQPPIELSRSHNLLRDDEKDRIISLGGGVVMIYGVWRVNGSLAVTRSIGDLHVKHLLIADPEITSFSLQSSDESFNQNNINNINTPCNLNNSSNNISNSSDDYLIIASDGLWDVMDFKEVSEFILKHSSSRHSICKLLCDEALLRKSKDNVTIVIVYFNNNKK